MSHASNAATFIDYQNVYDYLKHRASSSTYTDECILQMLNELRLLLDKEEQTRFGPCTAYADFPSLSSNSYYIQKNLYLQGVEARFVPVSVHKNALDLHLCADVMETLHHRTDIDTFVIVTGDNDYVPLFQTLMQHGRRTILVAFREKLAAELIRNRREGLFVDGRDLLDSEVRLHDSPSADLMPTQFQPPAELPYPIDRDALEIIEQHFGQYEEIYLTPLLRKLSEVLGDVEGHEPKTIIGDLEEAGAIRLEKRRGVRYDYTVLILNTEHPDVVAVREELSVRSVSGNEFYYGGDGDAGESDEEYDEEFRDGDWDDDR